MIGFTIFLLVSNAVVAAFAVVSCVVDVLTPGKLMFALPSNETTLIVLAVVNAVVVSAFPNIISYIETFNVSN